MLTSLIKVNSAPLLDDDFTFEFISFISNLVDTINEDLERIQTALNANVNGLKLPQFTQAQIIAMSATADNFTMWGCTDHVPPCIVAKVNGVLVQVNTSAFP